MMEDSYFMDEKPGITLMGRSNMKQITGMGRKPVWKPIGIYKV